METNAVPTQSIFQKEIHPIYQAGAAIALNTIGILIFSGTIDFENSPSDAVVLWEISFSILLAFMLFNSVFSIAYNNRVKYFRDSIFCFMAVAALGGVLAHYMSGMSMDEAGHFRWLYLCFTFTFLVFLSIVNLMRKIVDIAKRQDARLRGEEDYPN